MVDEFACVWPLVALEGVGDLIGDARPGFVAVDGGRRLGWANPAAATLFAAPARPGAPLALDRRLADRIARFAARAAPGEEARELLRFVAGDRPILRTVVFRRPIDADDAVIAVVDAAAAPDLGTIAAALAPLAADGGLAALFDAEGDVLGVAGDLDIAETLVDPIEAALAEADEIAVLERTLVLPTARHRLVLVRLGDRPDARRLLHLSPAEATVAPASAPESAAAPRPAPATVATPLVDDAIAADPAREPSDLLIMTPIEAAEPVTAEIESEPDDGRACEPADTTEPNLDDETDRLLVPAPARTIDPAFAAPQMPATGENGASTVEAAIDDDRFVAAPPLALDLFAEADETEEDLDRAWRLEAEAVDGPSPVREPAHAEETTEASFAAPSDETTRVTDAATPPTGEPTRNLETRNLEAPTEPARTVADDTDVAREPTAVAAPAENPLAAAEEPLPLAAAEEPLPLVAHGEADDASVEALLPEPSPLPAGPTSFDEGAEVAPLPLAEATTEPLPSIETPAEDVRPATEPLLSAATASPDGSETREAAPPPTGFVFTPLERPVKFVWQMDADRRFTLVSDEFAGVVGPAAADLVGRLWDDIDGRFGLDLDGTIGRALSRRDTWSGRSVLWPVEGTATRIPVDLAALPAFDRGRTFVGFRGFGTCRTDAPIPDPRAVGLRLAASPIRTNDVDGTASATSEIAIEPSLAPKAEEPTIPETSVETIPETPVDDAVAATSEILAVAPDTSTGEPEDGTIARTSLTSETEISIVAADTPAGTPDTVVAPEPVEPIAPADASAVACVVETLAEPPLFPDDRESAEDEVDHPIEPAFAGDIGDDPLFEKVADSALTDAEKAVKEALTGSGVPSPAGSPQAPEADTASTVPTDARAPRLVAVPRLGDPTDDDTRLSVPERNAFRQIARALGARIEGDGDDAEPPVAPAATPAVPPSEPARPRAFATADAGAPAIDTRLLDRLPLAVALLRDDALIHANERFLTLLRYPDLATLRASGGVDALFAGPHAARRFETADGRPMALIARDGMVVPCDARITPVPLDGGSGLLLTLSEHLAAPAAAAPSANHERVDELRAIVDTATDGVLMLDGSGLVLSANAGAEALFGVERRAMIGRPLTERLAPESHRSAMDYLDGLAANGVASVLNDGREVIGVVAPEGLIPLFMTIGRVSTGPVAKYCAVLRDITQWKKSEEELTAARRRAEESSIHKSDFLAKISHEIRTPLNAIIGFSELMLDERFGPIGSERYKDYLRDIHVSGSHIMSLVNDLLDLSKVEAGKMDLRFEAVPLAEVVSECVALMQPQANRERIIIRSSLPAGVPPVVADPRSMRQVVLNLLSNAVKFTPAGGQVIVSITLEDNGEVVLRVRDTGYGMSEKELQTALEPFRQLHTTRSRSGGTGLGLPLTKALTEANRAAFRIDSTVGQGTLVSVTFPVTRVLAG